jgi:hypothetical protein
MRTSPKLGFVLLGLWVAVSIGGCATANAPTADELKAIEHPTGTDAAWLEAVAPEAIAWYLKQEAILLKQGRPLSADEMDLARRMGVQHPEKIRVVVLTKFPSPDSPALAEQLAALGLGSDDAGGFSMGYAVLIKPRFETKRWLRAHEFVHVGQREHLGTEAFIRRYFMEMKTIGYKRAPLEIEAERRMAGQ